MHFCNLQMSTKESYIYTHIHCIIQLSLSLSSSLNWLGYGKYGKISRAKKLFQFQFDSYFVKNNQVQLMLGVPLELYYGSARVQHFCLIEIKS